MKSQIFTQLIEVPASAIDNLNHVNNVVYLQWCLDAAEAHWMNKTTPEIRAKNVWVVLNHSISYLNPSFLGEKLQIQTWIESYKGAKSVRKYKIIRPADNQVIIKAESLWCFLDAKSFRPTKITEAVSSLF